MFVHHMGAEAVKIVGKESPWRCATREDVRVRFYPRWIIVSARVDDLKGGESVEGYTEASATGWAKRIVQKSPVVRRTIRVCTGRSTFKAHGFSRKNKLYSERASGDALAERTMTNRDLYRRSHGAKSYCSAQASALVMLFALAAIIHRSPPAFQAEGRPTTGVTTTSLNVRVGSSTAMPASAVEVRVTSKSGKRLSRFTRDRR